MPSFEFYPLAILSLLQTGLTLLLLLPFPFPRPVIRLVKLTKSPVGYTVLGTLSTVLIAIFIAATLQLVDARSQTADYLQNLEAVHRRQAATGVVLVDKQASPHCLTAVSITGVLTGMQRQAQF